MEEAFVESPDRDVLDVEVVVKILIISNVHTFYITSSSSILQNKYPGITALTQRLSCWVGRGVFVLACQAQR